MRVEDIATHYDRESRRWSRRKAQQIRKQKPSVFGGKAVVLDVLNVSPKAKESEERLDWLIAYVNLMPQDVAQERTKEAFRLDSAEQGVVNKLLFEIW
ncbi:MAG: hypothetical protein GF398_14310 [Chitinivibrionales bacterium]|nr:hypothetical protein [Chitinivibrionales bacterium]